MSSGLFKNVIKNVFINLIYSIYMYKEDLAWKNLQKTKANHYTHKFAQWNIVTKLKPLQVWIKNKMSPPPKYIYWEVQ